jgi:chemotaxis family two-component system sensor histidine kinase/response regulator PixL
MAMESDIRDQAYAFFIEEAPELLQEIETGLLNLAEDRSLPKLHGLMRAAHSLKGGAASVGLEAIATLAHRLEDVFKALFGEEATFDAELENLLLQAFDCLQQPLLDQMAVGDCDGEGALAEAEPIFAQLEERLGEALLQADTVIASSADLGIDIAASIFEIDVAQGLERLEAVIAHPQGYAVAGELQAQAEVFAGFAELLRLPGFAAIAQAAMSALAANPDCAIEISSLALEDFRRGRTAVLAGDREQGGSPSAALLTLTQSGVAEEPSAIAPATPSLDELWSGEVTEVEVVSTWEGGPPLDRSDPVSSVPIEDIFGNPAATVAEADALSDIFGGLLPEAEVAEELLTEEVPTASPEETAAVSPEPTAAEAPPPSLAAALQAIQENFAQLPLPDDLRSLTAEFGADGSAIPANPFESRDTPAAAPYPLQNRRLSAGPGRQTSSGLSIRVDWERLQRLDNQVGELSINRNGLSLQNDRLQETVRFLLQRFEHFQGLARLLQDLSDRMLVSPDRQRSDVRFPTALAENASVWRQAGFDSLELDSYGELHQLLQELLEQTLQVGEAVGDISFFAGQSNHLLDRQRQMLGQLRDELMWARMLPLSEILNRFPRVLRDMSVQFGKPVGLKLSGTGVLVDRAILEKLYDPLLHLLRNAFDHGIEPPHVRRERGKSEKGTIEVLAYYRGNQTAIEVRDDGGGIDLDRVRYRAVELGYCTAEQAATVPSDRLLNLLFEPGFSTAERVNELSGRGVGLNIVRDQLRPLKGSATVRSDVGQGTTFILSLPLTLSISKLLVCLVGSTPLAFPSDNIEDIVTPAPNQVQQSGSQRLLNWRKQTIPLYSLTNLLQYRCPLPEVLNSQAIAAIPTPPDWANPILILRRDAHSATAEPCQYVALSVDRLATEQELVVKPFGAAIAPPRYAYGCTILGDGSLVPVLDGIALLASIDPAAVAALASLSPPAFPISEAPTLLVVDDSSTQRKTLAAACQQSGYRVLLARDGREALQQLEQNPTVQLVVCDIEMPNMNGFEFLSYRRQQPHLSAIPVVMLTSRSNDKHRRLALQLGASGYFTKPYLEVELLSAIEALRHAQGAFGDRQPAIPSAPASFPLDSL